MVRYLAGPHQRSLIHPECPNATNQYASDIEAEWAVLNWDAPTNTVTGVNYYLARIQKTVPSWNIVTPANGGTDNQVETVILVLIQL